MPYLNWEMGYKLVASALYFFWLLDLVWRSFASTCGSKMSKIGSSATKTVFGPWNFSSEQTERTSNYSQFTFNILLYWCSYEFIVIESSHRSHQGQGHTTLKAAFMKFVSFLPHVALKLLYLQEITATLHYAGWLSCFPSTMLHKHLSTQ